MQAMAFAGQALQLVGTIVQGNDADKVGTANANALNQRASQTLQAAGVREDQTRERGRQALAAQRSAMLANGVDPTSGSALVGSEQQMRDAELDALTVRYEGILQARDFNQQANLELAKGKFAKKQSRLSAVGQVLNAAGSYGSQRQLPAPVETRTPKPSPYYTG